MGQHRPDRWFKDATWYQGVQFRLPQTETPAPNGSCIDFVVGWFWAAAVETLHAADIPDTRLNHNGGDITIGAQLAQTGFKIRQFNRNKCYVACPSREGGGRRGYSEAFPWSKPT
jgi:hypothetical protein